MSKEKKPPFMQRIKGSKFSSFLRDKVRPVAGDVLEIVGDLTGVEAIERVGEMINNRQEESADMKKLALEFEKERMNFELEMHRADINLEIELYKSEVSDRISARERERYFMEISGGRRDWLMSAVIISGLLMLIGVMLSLIFITIPQENQRLADMAFGAIMSIGASIFSYYVGSTRSSRIKDESLHHAIKNT
jgi:hypothetical protein